MRKLLIYIISLYRYAVSPFLGDNCRFHPSCSHYAQDAIALHGVLKGSYLTLRRIGKCHPWHEGGVDPVPPCKHTH
ncbi:MAG: membrane protein insertion efficiency factor YidD [Haliea sp.]|tara:strand:- start:451 stop:678 length:228 start_codon:yes stop_codon:yes gene_type:complete